MPSIAQQDAAISEVTGGFDTHQDTRTAAVIDPVGGEGTGVYGAGPARPPHDEGVEVIEVDRPDRKARRFQGKSDPIDAIAAAKSPPAGERTGAPERRDGRIEALRNLRVARRSAVDQRADAQRQIKALIVTAPTSCASGCAAWASGS